VTKNVRRAADRHADQSMTVPFRMRQIWQLRIRHRTLNLPTATAPNRRSGATAWIVVVILRDHSGGLTVR
jgi:hypothetical protein